HQQEIAFLSSICEPDFGYITNFGKAHLEGFGSIEGVVKGKSELYEYLITNDKHVFLNADDTIQKEKLSHYIKKFGFSQNDINYFKIEFLEANPFVSFKIEDTLIKSHLIGEYNFTNLCAATIIGKYFNVDLPEIKKAIENYIPTNNRSQIIEKNSNTIILDAYNANPSSMEVALKNFSKQKQQHKVAILGDMFELGSSASKEHQKIANLATSLTFETILLVGENFYKTEIKNSKVKKYQSFEDFKIDFKPIKNSTLLIKGSRGMALERVLELL
ncbi:MAG: Mur ligase family protein, partial [Olleya sp.]